jgi:hypothetical protein
MLKQSEMSCWEIIQCNKKDTCFCAGDKKKSCWEFVKEDNFCSFHICVECLVYLAKHEQSTLSEEKFRSIMKQRKRNALKRNPSHGYVCPIVIKPKNTVKEYFPSMSDEMCR